MKTKNVQRHFSAQVLSILLVLVLTLGVAQAAQAAPLLATITVTNNADSGAGSLRQAVLDAANGDTILFDGDYTITFTSEIVIDKNLTIDGSGHTVTLNGNGVTRLLRVSSGTVTLNRIRIVNGSSSVANGGGVRNSGTLTVHDSTFAHNTTSAKGGGIYSDSDLTIIGSTFADNSAASGGGVYRNGGHLSITNSTFSKNSASSQGGGIYLFAASIETFNLTNVTLSGNAAASGGGVYKNAGVVIVKNTIIARSTTGGNCNSSLTDVGNNIDDGATCGFSPANSSLNNTNPLLSTTIADLGGPTQTFALLPGSPALDAGDDSICETTLDALDQRGISRPQGAACDIGAYESRGFSLIRITGDGQSAAVNSQFAQPLGVILSELSGNPLYGASINYAAPLSGASAAWNGSSTINILTNSLGVASAAAPKAVTMPGAYSVTASALGGTPSVSFSLTNVCANTLVVTNGDDGGDGSLRQAIANLCAGGTISFGGNYTVRLVSRLTLNKNLTIDGVGRSVTISGDSDANGVGDSGLFVVNNGVSATLNKLTLDKGSATKGGGVWNNGVLTLSNSTISNSSATDAGGVYNAATGTLNVNNSVILGNSVSGNGGGILNEGTLGVTNSTLSGNSAASGGAIFTNSALTASYSTLAENSATSNGGGIYNSGAAIINSTILANNGTGGNCHGSMINAGYNIDDAATCGFGSASSSQSNTDPLLSALGNHGGPTLTYALPVTSPAIDAGDALACPTSDQRGAARPQSSGCDIGAYELKKYSISGNTGTAAVILKYTDGIARTVTSGANGAYSLLVSDGWSGSVTPAKTGYIFSPASRSYTNVLASLTNQNYTATPLRAISGNAGVAGATLSYLDGTIKTVTANSNGAYTLQVPSGWSGNVTPSKTGYTFSPVKRTYTNVTANLSKQNYTATPITYSISGNAGVGGAQLSYTDGVLKSVTSDAQGAYSFQVSYNWSGTVTPAKTGYTFSPVNKSYTNVKANKTAQNYVATAITYTISGNAGVNGALLRYTDGSTKVITADVNGDYTIAVSYNWSGTVTPSKAGYIFTPPSSSYANVLANQTGQNYNATATAITYTISGNTGVGSVVLSYDNNGPQFALADSGGNYTFTVPYNWSGTVTPALSGYLFIPASRVYAPVLGDQTAQDYSAHVAVMQTFTSVATADGWLRESSETSNKGGTYNATATSIRAGDDALNRQYRSILSFDTSALPDNAVITSAVLRVRQYGKIIGVNPFNVLGSLRISIRTGVFGSAALEASDFQAAPTLTPVGTFSASPVNFWYSASLISPGRNRINKIGITQFRLAFSLDDNNNLASNYITFVSGNAANNKPELVITYYLAP